MMNDLKIPTFGSPENIRQVRWMARLFSLFPIGFFLVLFLFNDDVRTEPTLPTMIQGLATLFLAAAWRWEKQGGTLTMISALFLMIVIPINAVFNLNFSLFPAALGGVALALPIIIAGWLFYSVGCHAESPRTGEPAREHAGTNTRPTSAVLLIVGLVIAVILYLVGIILAEPQEPQELQEPQESLGLVSGSCLDDPQALLPPPSQLRPAAAAFPELTGREQEILTLMAQGRKNQEIANQLQINLKTVQNHVSNILTKLQVSDRAEAIL